MAVEDWLNGLFDSIDNQDLESFVGNLTEDAEFRFGNMASVRGRQAIGDSVAGFFGSIDALKHTLIDFWEAGDAIICRGTVVYTRHDGEEMCFPFANIMKRQGDLVSEYYIYADISPLYA